MDAAALYKAGQLRPAIEALGTELRKQPTDTKRRIFLFELLCFAGEYARASKQLDILADSSKDAESGAMLYRAALHAQQTREGMFERGELPQSAEASSPKGTLNGDAFEELTDEDSRIGSSLEVFIAGSYTWVPFKYVESIKIQAPARLRDLLWAPAILKATKDFRLQDLGQVLLPVMAPLSWKHEDDEVKLGRSTVWVADERYGAVPAGQKLFVADEREFPLLEIRQIEFGQASQDGRDSEDGSAEDSLPKDEG